MHCSPKNYRPFSAHYNIISLSTGHFQLYPTEEKHIVIAIVGIFEKKEQNQESNPRINKMIQFYENKNFGKSSKIQCMQNIQSWHSLCRIAFCEPTCFEPKIKNRKGSLRFVRGCWYINKCDHFKR